MENKLELFKLSRQGEFDNIELKIFSNNNQIKNFYNLSFGLSSNYWNSNLSNPYILCLIDSKGDKNDKVEILSKENLREKENTIISYFEKKKLKFNELQLSSRYDGWEFAKGDYLLPPPEIRFKKRKKVIFLKILKELGQALIFIPFIVLIVFYFLKSFSDN